MKLSIIVLNYNYGRYVAQAIESALAQTVADKEVIVVDNGSTDGSAQVIARYAQQVRVVTQATNMGQGQGYNLGFEASSGEWVIWLDADDVLDPQAMQRCLDKAKEDTAKVQFTLRHIDGEGCALGGYTPHVCHEGDVRDIIRLFGVYAGPPGSGNLYRRSAIAPYFPVPPMDWPICTDTVPFVTAACHGQVVDAHATLGSYRLHNRTQADAPGYQGNYCKNVAEEVRLLDGARDKTLALLRERSGIRFDAPLLTMPTLVRRRIVSWCWSQQVHPYPQDTAASLWRLMRKSIQHYPGYRRREKVLMLGWAAVVLSLPLRWSQKMVAHPRLNLLQIRAAQAGASES